MPLLKSLRRSRHRTSASTAAPPGRPRGSVPAGPATERPAAAVFHHLLLGPPGGVHRDVRKPSGADTGVPRTGAPHGTAKLHGHPLLGGKRHGFPLPLALTQEKVTALGELGF